MPAEPITAGTTTIIATSTSIRLKPSSRFLAYCWTVMPAI